MNCVCVGGGGGCSVANTTAEQYLAAFGYSNNFPLSDSAYQQIASGNVPANQTDATAWEQLAIACMKARALLFCNSNPGDVSGVSEQQAVAQIANIGKVASSGLQVGSSALSLAGLTAGTLAGGITLGLSTVLTAIITIFTNHAKAEQTQATVLANICPAATAAIRQIDYLVSSGQETPLDAESALQQIYEEFASSAQPYSKPCNAFCGYTAIMFCMIAMSPYLYSTSAYEPKGQSVPVSTVMQVQQTPVATASVLAVQAGAPVASTESNYSIIIVVIIAALAVIFLTFRRG